MPQSLVQNYIHIIFSTKNRVTSFTDRNLRDEMHRYLGGVCSHQDSQPVIVGGHIDHVHVVCRLSKSIAVEALIRELKVDSSKWVKTKDASLSDFHWQSGYGAFSVSPSHLDPLVQYVKNQEEHHRKESFMDEFRRLLKKYNVPYDERFLWD